MNSKRLQSHTTVRKLYAPVPNAALTKLAPHVLCYVNLRERHPKLMSTIIFIYNELHNNMNYALNKYKLQT